MPRLLTQHDSVDNPGNARAHMAKIAAIITRTFSIRELIHASSATTCQAGRSSFIRLIAAGPRCIFQVSALSSLCDGRHESGFDSCEGAQEGGRRANHPLMARGDGDETY